MNRQNSITNTHQSFKGRTVELNVTSENGWDEYFWKNSKGIVVSPKFPKKTLALEWFTLHEEWMEDERPPNLMIRDD